MLEAVSDGGRIGFGAPFMPRSCDMRWSTTEEVCEIVSCFDKVIAIGDSMMRHVVGALNVLLRASAMVQSQTETSAQKKGKHYLSGSLSLFPAVKVYLSNICGTSRHECFCNK